jgi:predicted ATPase
MITKWRLFNFKSVKSDTSLEFGPLTIFAGPNSSGKSTWIQSLLLVSQTLSNRVRSRSVVLNGSLTRLGQFDDLKSYGGDANEIVVGCECEPQRESPIMMLEGPQTTGRRMVFYGRNTDQLKGVSCELAFDANVDSPQRDLYQLQPQLYSCRVGATVRGEDNIDAKSWIEIRRANLSSAESVAEKIRVLGIEDPDNEVMKKSLELDVSLDEDSLQDIKSEYATATPVGCITRHFLPETLGLRINVAEEEARAVVSTICDETPRGIRRRMGLDREVTIPAQVLAVLKEVLGDELWSQVLREGEQSILFTKETESVVTLRDWSTQVRRLPPVRRSEIRRRIQASPGLTSKLVAAFKTGKPARFIVVPNPPPSDVMDGVTYLDYFFTNAVKYLGPLRDEPKALYPLATGIDPSDVGLRGEYTAAVLDLHKGQRIRYLPTSSFQSPEIKPLTSMRTLEAAVTDWLFYLGVAESVVTVDKGKLGHELKVVPPGLSQPHDLTHVGVGVSQVLPILVMCLLAEPDTTLVFEQPELHLHPKVQTLLGDFFLSMGILGKQCVLETHSEYLINRLRFRSAAETGKSELARAIKMYFVEKRGDTSFFRPVVVNEFGAIPDWPDGFFDQSQSEAEQILRAATRKRQARGGRLPRAERHD